MPIYLYSITSLHIFKNLFVMDINSVPGVLQSVLNDQADVLVYCVDASTGE